MTSHLVPLLLPVWVYVTVLLERVAWFTQGGHPSLPEWLFATPWLATVRLLGGVLENLLELLPEAFHVLA